MRDSFVPVFIGLFVALLVGNGVWRGTESGPQFRGVASAHSWDGQHLHPKYAD